MLSEEESKERLEEVDEDGDGRVKWKEYVQETYGIDLDGESSSIPLNDIEEQQVRLSSIELTLDLLFIVFILASITGEAI